MEAWLAGTPVLVHSGCAVTRGHVEAAGGGLHFADYPHFAECLDLLLARPELRQRLAAAGREYVLANYSWPRVTERYLRLIERIDGESGPAGRPRVPARARPRRQPGPPCTRCCRISPPATPSATRSWRCRRRSGRGACARRSSRATCRSGCGARRAPSRSTPARPARTTCSSSTSRSATGWPTSCPACPGARCCAITTSPRPTILEGVYPDGAERCRQGRRQLPRLAGAVELGLGVSAFNCAELVEAGCAAVEEVPILLDLAVLDDRRPTRGCSPASATAGPRCCTSAASCRTSASRTWSRRTTG